VRQDAAPGITCLTYCKLPYAGGGWPQSCVNILSQFASQSIRPILFVPRRRAEGPENIEFRQCLHVPFARLPWSLVRSMADRQLAQDFRRALDAADPQSTIAYFWPGSPPELVQHAKQLGIVTVREMINCCMATAKPILDRAYRRAGLAPAHAITEEAAAAELLELALYDFVFASNPCAEASLVEAGVSAERILPTSFGWEPARFAGTGAVERGDGFRALFVGTACVRKGIPELLEAWKRSGIAGELLIVGDVEPCLGRRLAEAAQHGVRLMPFTANLGDLYRSCDAFVFPTLEEGGPQVTLEAGGCGVPVITTPMGASRMVDDGRNGLVVPPGDVASLAAALVHLSADAALRQRFARQIAIDAQAFAYDRVSIARAGILKGLLGVRSSPELEFERVVQN
jgi:glycosyltransferase involved in cell wall biosynthesis